MFDVVSFGKKGYSIACGDALSVLKEIPSGVVQCAVTSPPYY